MGLCHRSPLWDDPCVSCAVQLLHCRGSMKNSLTFACWKHPTVKEKLQQTGVQSRTR